MSFTPQQLSTAQAAQHKAAHADARAVRLIAGPGSGKSHSIAERVRWLIETQVNAEDIAVVSFTNASVNDLRESFQKYALKENMPEVGAVEVSTLHSLALKTLKSGGLLEDYQQTPEILLGYELENIFDAEFGLFAGVPPTRVADIRKYYAAYWNTGEQNAATYAPPKAQVTAQEKDSFTKFHKPTCHVYSCVLMDELVRQCVESIENGRLELRDTIRFTHLIVDEYQDFCAADIRFIDLIAEHGVNVFVAGDDDQSIYLFRHASPAGIQRMKTRYPDLEEYALEANFRCGANILNAAVSLVTHYASPDRIEKHLYPLYAESAPPVNGSVLLWQFDEVGQEAQALAQSCKRLIQEGVSPKDILILLATASEQGELWPPLRQALTNAGVPFVAPKEPGFTDNHAGALLKTLLKIVLDRDEDNKPCNAIAHRLLFGMQKSCGVKTCAAVRDWVRSRPYTTYLSLFYSEEMPQIGNKRAEGFLESTRAIVRQLLPWTKEDKLVDRAEELCEIVSRVIGDEYGNLCNEYMGSLSEEMQLRELSDYLGAKDEAAKEKVLKRFRSRLKLPEPEVPEFPPKVRVMTMHSAKGLTVKVAFIPGLEQGHLPSHRNLRYPAMVAEDARRLYVSITRAQAACVMSCATNRRQGASTDITRPSEFMGYAGGKIERHRRTALTNEEVSVIMQDIANLSK